ncbi:MAG: exo-alpha-sialidase [Acidobacteriota bacterium]
MRPTGVFLSLAFLLFFPKSICNGQPGPEPLISEFIFTEAPFRSCHASTITEAPDGRLMAAWFGGEDEGADNVEIWMSEKTGEAAWSAPRAMTSYPNMPCWNPVLFRDSSNRIWLFFKVGPNPQSWTGAYRILEGSIWGEVQYLPAGLLGPIRNKPITLANGDILAPTSVESGYRGGTPADAPSRSWASWVEVSSDGGKTWARHGPITVPGQNFGVIQPTVWEVTPGHLVMLMRSSLRIGAICRSESRDGGKTWEPARPTALPNPNSGVDAVKLKDGRVALVYNHTRFGRSPLNVAFSSDNGLTWDKPVVLENQPGEYSYPAVIQSSDGLLHITYTWKRQRIKHVVLKP